MQIGAAWNYIDILNLCLLKEAFHFCNQLYIVHIHILVFLGISRFRKWIIHSNIKMEPFSFTEYNIIERYIQRFHINIVSMSMILTLWACMGSLKKIKRLCSNTFAGHMESLQSFLALLKTSASGKIISMFY